MKDNLLHQPRSVNVYVVKRRLFPVLLLCILLFAGFESLSAQDGLGDAFKKSKIEKVDHEDRGKFLDRFEDIKWTGQGLNNPAVIDKIPTIELRARLQSNYGAPTQKLEDLIGKKDFRPAKYIQFEYWFTVNDTIPLMVLDLDGPFDKGLVYGGASRYIDLMPQIKRTFSQNLMDVDSLAGFKDYYYHIKRKQWYLVRYNDGEFEKEEIEQPDHLQLHPDSEFKNY